jgi:hypothetical protein
VLPARQRRFFHGQLPCRLRCLTGPLRLGGELLPVLLRRLLVGDISLARLLQPFPGRHRRCFSLQCQAGLTNHLESILTALVFPRRLAAQLPLAGLAVFLRIHGLRLARQFRDLFLQLRLRLKSSLKNPASPAIMNQLIHF